VFFGTAEGLDYTWFVQGREAIAPSLQSLTTEQASKSIAPGVATIAAHANHILYTLRGDNAYFGSPEPEGSWEDSWSVQQVNAAQWDELRAAILREYEQLQTNLSGHEPTNEQEMLGLLSAVPHMAYHLGAIRQLMKLL